MFNVYRLTPQYDFRDAIVGERAIKQPMTYVTEGGAIAAARLLARSEDERYGDDHFVARPVGVSPFAPHISDWAVTARTSVGTAYGDDEIPF